MIREIFRIRPLTRRSDENAAIAETGPQTPRPVFSQAMETHLGNPLEGLACTRQREQAAQNGF
jgi:hypothetical protein